MNNDFILKLYNTPSTVFTVHEVAQMFPALSNESVQDRLYYFAKVGKLIHPHQGIYTKTRYELLELANKLYTPSYISLETVLAKGGVIFQFYETVFAVSYLTRTVTIGDDTIQYRRMKKEVLPNTEGISFMDGYYQASLERAFLDAVYTYKDYHFDNLEKISWEKVMNLKKIYHNAAFERRVNQYYQLYKEEHAQH